MTDRSEVQPLPAPGSIRAWLMALRLRTLPAALSPVIAGGALAAREGRLDVGMTVAAALGALLLQLLSNLANDVFDFQKGADANRVGPPRVASLGLLSAKQLYGGMVVCLGLAAAVGAVLILHAGLPILVIGVAGMIAAVAYTGGPFPLAYHGLGELFVFLFFGLCAVGGTYFVSTDDINAPVLLIGAALGTITAAILVVNNVRDYQTDAEAQKNTLVVRYGQGFGRRLYGVLLAATYILITVVAFWFNNLAVLLPLVTLPRAISYAIRVRQAEEGREFNALLGATALLTLVISVYLAIGLQIELPMEDWL